MTRLSLLSVATFRIELLPPADSGSAADAVTADQAFVATASVFAACVIAQAASVAVAAAVQVTCQDRSQEPSEHSRVAAQVVVEAGHESQAAAGTPS